MAIVVPHPQPAGGVSWRSGIMAPANRPSHVPVLDGLRGLAIFLVLLCHFTLYGGLFSGFLAPLRPAAIAGWSGVDLFFVLSGFLITGILYDAKGTQFYFRNFYIRRVLRIFPLYYGFLAVFFVGIPSLVDIAAPYQQLRDEQVWYWTYLANFKMAADGWPAHLSVGHFWSLAVEEQFYLIWPLVIHLLSRRALIAVCTASLGGALLVRVGLWWVGEDLAAYVLTPARMDGLALGGLVAILARSPRGLVRWRPSAQLTALGSGAILVGLYAWRGRLVPEDPVVFTVGISVIALLFGSLVTLVLTSPASGFLERAFSSGPLTFLGRYSYGIYVFHIPILGVVRRSHLVTSGPGTLGPNAGLRVITLLIVAAVILGAAILSWHFYENRFLRWKDRFRLGDSVTIPSPSRLSVWHHIRFRGIRRRNKLLE
jgi:peptidoglycan/LPS O-acetylase OafA/YrhL